MRRGQGWLLLEYALGDEVAVSKKTRFEIFKRDRFTCQYCGRTPPTVTLECDHIDPVANGGTDDELNLVTSCFDCNRGKSDRKLDSVPSPLIEQQRVAIEQKEQFKVYNDYLMELREEELKLIKKIGLYWYSKITKEQSYCFAGARINTIQTFLKHLMPAEIYDAIDIAHNRLTPHGVFKDEKTFTYFCGVCWKRIRSKTGGK